MPVTTVFLLLVGQTNDLDVVADLELATLHTTGSNGATAGDGEDVLDGHQEGQVSRYGREWGYSRQQRPSAP